MTGGDRRRPDRPTISRSSGTSRGCSARPPELVRDYAFDGVTIDPGEDLRLAAPDRGPRPPRPDEPRPPRRRRHLDDLADANVLAASARSTVPLELEIEDEALPSIDIHTGTAVTISPGGRRRRTSSA